MRDARLISAPDVVARWGEFNCILDARSPTEFALDHLPGAMNTPVLDDEERALIGLINAEQGAFEAKRAGAARVSRNIAALLETRFAAYPRDWSPLVYCWRGGQRSGSLATVLARVGWSVSLIEGGYKAFRKAMLEDLERRCAALQTVVIAGRTGTAKTRLLGALREQGAQVLDLEGLALHRGSVLGQWPQGASQPSQKHFETLLWDAVRALDPEQIVYVESESRKIGQCQVPEALILRMRAGPIVQIDVPLAERTAFLVQDYAHLCRADGPLIDQLRRLTPLHGHEAVNAWIELALASRWADLVERLLTQHYDPAYDRSIARNFGQRTTSPQVVLTRLDADGLQSGAREVIALTPSVLTPSVLTPSELTPSLPRLG